jgi:hypothetical protein
LRRAKIDSRSWNAAIRAVQQDIFAMGARRDVSDQENRVLTAVFSRCEELRARKYPVFEPTNRQLAKKYAVSPRTVTNWRKKGCPFDKGQWQVLDWMFERPYLPRRAKEKFSGQFGHRFRRACVDLRATFVLLGLPIPDHLRQI